MANAEADPDEDTTEAEAEIIDPAELDDVADVADVEETTPALSKPRPAPIPARSDRDYEPVSALTQYMNQLSHHAPISREEEHELAVRWAEEGDVEAARKMVLSNLRLVVKIAMEYRRAWTNTLDLIQEGNVGLMEAVQRYDPYRGVKLTSYAVYWIRAYILKYILDNMRSVRLGTTRASRKLFFRLNKERQELERQGFEVTPMLLAERLDVTESDVVEMETRLSRPDLSMSAPVHRDESGSATYGDTFATQGASAETQVGDGEMQRVFHEAIEDFSLNLKARDLKILEQRVLAEEPMTLAEMGEQFGVSRERVRQLEARIIDQLRAFLKERLPDFEYYAAADQE